MQLEDFRWNNEEFNTQCIDRGKAKIGAKNSFYCKSHTKEVRQIISKANKGRFVGEKGSNWQGGITSINYTIRNCYEYKIWRKNIFERDNYICQECNNGSNKLNADHIKPFAVILMENNIQSLEDALKCKELWNLDNGQTLCVECHKKTETYGWNTYWAKVHKNQERVAV